MLMVMSNAALSQGFFITGNQEYWNGKVVDLVEDFNRSNKMGKPPRRKGTSRITPYCNEGTALRRQHLHRNAVAQESSDAEPSRARVRFIGFIAMKPVTSIRFNN